GGRFPTAATKHVIFAVGRSARVLVGTRFIVALIVNVLAPLGHVAVHVAQAPRIGPLQANWMRLLVGIVCEPAYVTELARVIAKRVVAAGAGPASVFPLRLGGQAIAVG